jgi:hypothetical protein
MPFYNGLNGLTGLSSANAINGNGSYHSSPITPARVNSTIGEDESELATLYQKLEHYQQYESDKNNFMAVRDSEPLPRAQSLTPPGTLRATRVFNATEQDSRSRAQARVWNRWLMADRKDAI